MTQSRASPHLCSSPNKTPTRLVIIKGGRRTLFAVRSWHNFGCSKKRRKEMLHSPNAEFVRGPPGPPSPFSRCPNEECPKFLSRERKKVTRAFKKKLTVAVASLAEREDDRGKENLDFFYLAESRATPKSLLSIQLAMIFIFGRKRGGGLVWWARGGGGDCSNA